MKRPTGKRHANRATRPDRPLDGADVISQGTLEAVQFMMRILQGKPVRSEGKWRRPTMRDRVRAATWLADRGWGKPVTMVELDQMLNGSADGTWPR